MLRSKLHLIIIVAPESYTVSRQIWVKVSTFLVVSGPLHTGHTTQRMRNGHFRLYNGPWHYNGGNSRVSEHRHLLFVKLLEHGKLE